MRTDRRIEVLTQGERVAGRGSSLVSCGPGDLRGGPRGYGGGMRDNGAGGGGLSFMGRRRVRTVVLGSHSRRMWRMAVTRQEGEATTLDS